MAEKQSPETGPVLIVEDSMDDFEAARRAFKKAGLVSALDHVSTGEEALQYLKSQDKPRPSLILLDLNMPGMGGRKVLEIIKQDKDMKEIPVVVLTTSKAEEDIARTYNLGVNSFVTKPVTFSSLVTVISDITHYWFEIVELPAQKK